MSRFAVMMRVAAAVLLAAALLVLLVHGVRVNTSLYDLLPAGDNSGATRVLEQMARAGTRQVNVLIKGRSEQEVLSRAAEFRSRLPQGILSVTEQGGVVKISAFLSQYRFQLLSSRHRQMLQQNAHATLRDEALANLYSFVPLALYSVDEDPYGFATSFLLENPLLRQNGFEPRDGVLLAHRGEVHYAYLPLLLPEAAADSLPVMQAHINALAALCRTPGIMLCGTPVHTWKASSSSQQAMGVLSILSVLMLAALFFWVFSSLRGMVIMALTLGAAAVVAMAATVLLYGNVHILSLVFGCSLVGISTDYVVHYLVEHHDAGDARLSPVLRRSLLLGLLTSSLGYATFYIARVDLLGQIATLSIAGLSASMLFIFAFYPFVYKNHVPVFLRNGALNAGRIVARWHTPAWLPWGVALCCLILAVRCLPVCDDLRSFYRPSPELLEAEKELALLNGMADGVVTLAVHGDSTEEILQRQEKVGEALLAAGVPYYTAASTLVPSAARQKANFEQVKTLVAMYEDEIPVALPESWPGPLLPEMLLKADSPFASLASLWSPGCGLILVPGKYRELLRALPEQEWLKQEDRFADLQQQVRQWRVTLIRLMAGVGVLVISLLALVFGLRSALLIAGPPAAGVLMVFGVLAAAGIPLTLFHVLACYLILGLGCDYAIFRASRSSADFHTALAVCLSFLTSWSVFGVLAFTDFSVTQDMGVAISVGLTAAYVLSPAATGAATLPRKARCVLRK